MNRSCYCQYSRVVVVFQFIGNNSLIIFTFLLYIHFEHGQWFDIENWNCVQQKAITKLVYLIILLLHIIPNWFHWKKYLIIIDDQNQLMFLKVNKKSWRRIFRTALVIMTSFCIGKCPFQALWLIYSATMKFESTHQREGSLQIR